MKKHYRSLITLSLAPMCGVMAQSEKVSERPNVLLILADDLGWSDIGCYGSEIHTPHIDGLAKDGMRFTQYHNSSKSYPSRACLLTGLYAQQNGYFKHFGGPLENCITLGEYMKSAGYLTLWSGKHHGSENPRTRGFDHYIGLKDGACNYFNPGLQRDGEEVPAQKSHRRKWCIEDKEYAPYTPTDRNFYTTDHFTDNALKWLDQYKSDERPFFLFLSYNAPHDPLMAWPEDIAKYEGQYKAGYEKVRKARFEKQRKLGIIDKRYKLSEPIYEAWESLSPERQTEEAKKMEVYAAMIDRMDQNIGRVIDKLKEQGKYENTIIIFMSDNGASAEVVNVPTSYGPIGTVSNWKSLGENWANVANTPFRYYKNISYQGGICAPMIVTWPKGGVKAGTKSDFVGHMIDIMPTFMDIAGTDYPDKYKGRTILPCEGTSLLPAMLGKNVEREKPVYWEWQYGRAVRDGKWKLVKQGLDSPWSLFDMEKDPTETIDLASKYPEIVKRMDQMFNDWKKRVSITKGIKAIK